MTIDKILNSVDAYRPDLDSTVKQFREMGAAMELVLADHFGVEDLAIGVEQLATRLARIRSVLEPHLAAGSAAGDLARPIDAIALPPEAEPATALVEAAFSGPDDYTFSITERRLYGHPDLRHVYRYGFDHGATTGTHADYLVQLPSATVLKVPEKDTIFTAADSFEAALKPTPNPPLKRPPDRGPEHTEVTAQGGWLPGPGGRGIIGPWTTPPTGSAAPSTGPRRRFGRRLR